MGKIRHLGDFMYLYFKDDGKLFMKSNVLEPDMESTYTKKCIVPKTFSLLKDGIDDDGNNIQVEMNYEEVITATSYKEKRAIAYPSMAEQLDKIFNEGLEAWKEQIQEIKNKHPKGE